MIHLIFSNSGWKKCKSYISTGDEIVFLEDGCYVAHPIDQVNSYMLTDHANERSVRDTEEMTKCDMSHLVQLLTQHEKSISWK